MSSAHALAPANPLPRILLALVTLSVCAVLLVPYATLEALQTRLPLVGSTLHWLETLAPGRDMEHLVAFAVLGVFTRLAQKRTRLVATGLLATCGVATEMAQLWIPSRSVTTDDLLLNVVGGVLGYVVASAAIRTLCPHPSPLPGGEGARGALRQRA